MLHICLKLLSFAPLLLNSNLVQAAWTALECSFFCPLNVVTRSYSMALLSPYLKKSCLLNSWRDKPLLQTLYSNQIDNKSLTRPLNLHFSVEENHDPNRMGSWNNKRMIILHGTKIQFSWFPTSNSQGDPWGLCSQGLQKLKHMVINRVVPQWT